MIDFSTFSLFCVTSFFLCLAPGPDNIYVLLQGVTNSKKAALITTLGLSCGIIIHTLATTFGISVIFQTSKIAFDIVKYIGALYLLYLGYKAFKHRNDTLDLNSKTDKKELKQLFIKGFFMNILNPKVSIFFLAFFPQFIDYSNGNVSFQMITLGSIFMILTILVFSSIGIAGSILRQRLLAKPSIVKYMNVLTSFILISLSIKLALAEK